MYADLAGNRKKQRIKSLCGNRVRISYDAFVLNNKADAIWYQGPAGALT